jgi:hypothetical protein
MEADNLKQQSMRIDIAKECNAHYGTNYHVKDITDCDGCKGGTERLFSGCHKCEIRSCASLRNIETCASCEEFACEKLSAMFKMDPAAKTRLEQIRILSSYR